MNKFQDAKNYLKSRYLEREEVIDAIFVAIVARQHCLLLGPPGTAKSALVMDIAGQFSGFNYFQWLLTRFSTPEELFGPLSLRALEEDVYRRNTKGKLPEAHMAFLDEIFKAGSAILNTFLTLVNERIFYNDGTPVKSPLQTVIGASNEYPEEDEGLEALYDRFLLRFELKYIGEEGNFIKMLQSETNITPPPLAISYDELADMQMVADMVNIPKDIIFTINSIRNELKDNGIQISDRRFMKALPLIRANAALNGRFEVMAADLSILRNGLWETPDQRETCATVIDAYSMDKVQSEIERIQKVVLETMSAVQNDPSSEIGMEATQKMKFCIVDLASLNQQYPNRSAEIIAMRTKVDEANQRIANVMIGV